MRRFSSRSSRPWALLILCAVLQVFIHLAALHDEYSASSRGHILERIAVKRDNVGLHARRNGADLYLIFNDAAESVVVELSAAMGS